MQPFAMVYQMQLASGLIRTMSGNPFGLRLAALRNSQDPGPIEAVAIYVPKGEVVQWDFSVPVVRINLRTSCVSEPGRPECRAVCVPNSYNMRGPADVADVDFQEPAYDIPLGLSAKVPGKAILIPMARLTLGCHQDKTDTIFDSFKFDVA